LNFRQLAKQKICDGQSFDSSVKTALNMAMRDQGKSVGQMPVLQFRSYVFVDRHINTPLVADIDIALQHRQQLLALKSSGASVGEVLSEKDRMLAEVVLTRNKRRGPSHTELTGQRREERKRAAAAAVTAVCAAAEKQKSHRVR